MSSDPEIVLSPLCQAIEEEGQSVQVEIYGCEPGKWVLEIIDQHNNSTVWDDEFETDEQALREARRTIEVEGIRALVGEPSVRG